MAKKGQVFRKYSPEFKLSVILEKLDKKVEEDLKAENQRLRIEIEYLK